VLQLTDRDLERRGWKPTPDAGLPDLGQVGSVPFGPEDRLRPTIRGIDPGWNYNPGAQTFAGLVARATEVLARAEAAGLNLAATETREAILTELEKVLGRTLAVALLGELVAATALAAASRRGKKRGKKVEGGPGPRRSTFRPDQGRDPRTGRWVDEGKRTKRDDLRLDHTRQWVGDATKPDANPGPALQVGTASPRTMGRLQDLGLKVHSPNVMLEHGHTRHTISGHGAASEGDRGQRPVTADDLHRTPDLLNRADSISLVTDERRLHRSSAPRVEVFANANGERYELLFEMQRKGIVLRDVWIKKG
jgi:hypothetical protein